MTDNVLNNLNGHCINQYVYVKHTFIIQSMYYNYVIYGYIKLPLM